MSSQELQQLAELAYKFGPFFFSILFVMFLTRWSYKNYSAAVSQNPPIDPTDKKINRTMFVTYLFVGVALVALSVTWWWFFKPGVYLFIGKIKDLQPQDEIAADIYYLKCQYRGPLSAEDSIGQLRDEEFIIVGTHPFKKGQSFALEFSKNHQRRQKLWIIYEGDTDEPVFELQYDETNNRFFLKSVSEGAAPTEKKNASSFLSFFEARAWASVSESSQKAQAQTGEPKADESLIKV